MRTLSTVALLVLTLTPLHAAEPTLDEVLARYAAARGGLERWRAVERIELEGFYTAYSVRQPFRLLQQRPRYYRFESTILDNDTTYAHDEQGPWWIEPVFGFSWARRPPAPFDDQLRRRAAFEPLLMSARDDGHRVELVGRGDVDGQPTHELRLTLTDGSVETWHLDADTFLEVAVDAVVYDYTQTLDPIDERAYFMDFRPVGGLVLPHRVEREYLARHTVLEVTEVRLGEAPDTSSFTLPLSEGMEWLRPLAGEWQVTVETRRSPEAPWSAVETRSTIEPRLDGALLEERLTWSGIGENPRLVRHYSFDRYRKVFRVSQVDDLTHHMKVFEGVRNGERLELSNEATGTGWSYGETEVLERPVLHDLTSDGFRIDWQRSTDGGESWETLLRFGYER